MNNFIPYSNVQKLNSYRLSSVVYLSKLRTTQQKSKDHFVVGETQFFQAYIMSYACKMGRMPRSLPDLMANFVVIACLVRYRRKRLSHTE